MECIFCKIAKGEIPNSTVYEDEKFLAFLDIAPANKGHTLVIPKEHFETITDLPEELLKELIERVQKISQGLKESLKAEGYNVFVNNHPVAGQIVPHVHFHIVPRFAGDGIRFDWPSRKYESGEREEILQKITTFLNG